MKARDWEYSGLLTSTRVVGEILFRINGSGVDIWIKDNTQKVNWYGVQKKDLLAWLKKPRKHDDELILTAESDMELKKTCKECGQPISDGV